MFIIPAMRLMSPLSTHVLQEHAYAKTPAMLLRGIAVLPRWCVPRRGAGEWHAQEAIATLRSRTRRGECAMRFPARRTLHSRARQYAAGSMRSTRREVRAAAAAASARHCAPSTARRQTATSEMRSQFCSKGSVSQLLRLRESPRPAPSRCGAAGAAPASLPATAFLCRPSVFRRRARPCAIPAALPSRASLQRGLPQARLSGSLAAYL